MKDGKHQVLKIPITDAEAELLQRASDDDRRDIIKMLAEKHLGCSVQWRWKLIVHIVVKRLKEVGS